MANTAFYEPFDFGCFDLATSQVTKEMEFAWDTAVIAGAKVVTTYKDREIKAYTVGAGLTLSNSDLTVTLSLDGADYAEYEGRTVQAHCNFFLLGDIEVTFALEIIKSHL